MATLSAGWSVATTTVAFATNTAVTFGLGTNNSSRRFGMEDNKTVSDAYPTLVTPAGYAFSIWGAIFGLQTAFTAVEAYRYITDPSAFASGVPVLYWSGACLLQALWAILFGRRKIGQAAVVLSSIALCLNMVHTSVVAEPQGMPLMYRVPFALHFSWCISASLVNWNIWLEQNRASTFARSATAWLSVMTACIAGSVITIVRGDPVVGLVSAWSLLAIGVRRKDPIRLGLSVHSLRLFSQACYALAAGACGVSLWTFAWGKGGI